MKFKILSILTLFCLNAFAQEVLRVDYPGTEGFEYIEFRVKLDEKDSIIQIEYNPEKSTFKEILVIEQIKNNYSKFRKDIFGMDDFSNLSNHSNEITSTVVFLDPELLTQKIEDPENCERLKSGVFNYGNVLYTDTKIYRYQNVQIEVNKDHYLKYRIIWNSPCRYQLILEETNDDKYDSFQSNKPITVEIIKAAPDFYIYRSEMGGKEKVGIILND